MTSPPVDKVNSSTERAQLRKQLLSNGYKPLPLVDKGIRIKGWTTVDIDQEWLQKFERSAKYRNTGIRCDGLIAFDIDITREDLADEIEDYITDRVGFTDLCRVGAWPKRLLLYRLDGEASRSLRTGKYEGHMVEVLTTAGRQFAAFGRHPSGVDYTWLDGHSPVNVGIDALPVISFEQAVSVADGIETLFVEKGLERDCPGGSRGPGGSSQYDIDDSWEFLTLDGEIVPWSELRVRLGKEGEWGNLKRENGEFGDSGSVHAFLSFGTGEPCIHDFARDETHFEQPVSSGLSKALPPAPDDGGGIFQCPNLKFMLETFVLLGDQTVRYIDHPERVYTYQGINTRYAHLSTHTPTNKDPNKMTGTVPVWRTHPDALRADHCEMRPDHAGEALIAEGKQTVFNTYRPPQHVGKGDLSVVFEFVSHLIPDEAERALFWDWHATKWARPDWRLHALIMVTPAFGTGRGTWFSILNRLFGTMYVKSIDFSDLIGQGSQSAYNDYLSESLIVTVNEALEIDLDHSRWQLRHSSYERLKQIVDPGESMTRVKAKYGKIAYERVFASLIIATNHNDALAIVPGDRRLNVISNTMTPLTMAPDRLMERVHEWYREPGNIAALAGWLDERWVRGIEYDPFGEPMDTRARREMIELGKNDLEKVFDSYVEGVNGDVCTVAQWRMFVFDAVRGQQYSLPEGAALDRALIAVLQRRGVRPQLENDSGQIKVKGHKVRPWIVRHADKWLYAENVALRVEILKNGEPGGAVLPMK